jgi:hypothetical protein
MGVECGGVSVGEWRELDVRTFSRAVTIFNLSKSQTQSLSDSSTTLTSPTTSHQHISTAQPGNTSHQSIPASFDRRSGYDTRVKLPYAASKLPHCRL